MPTAYSLDLRKKIVEACARGGRTQRQVAEDIGIGIASVVRFVIRFRLGKLAYERPKTLPNRRVLGDAGEQKLLELARATPDATERELADDLAQSGHRVSRSTVSRVLHRNGFTRKKRPTSRQSGAPTG